MYDKDDDSYFNLLKDDYKLIIDMDDTRNNKYGEYYDNKHPITLDKIRKVS